MKIETIGQAIDYLKEDENRRVECKSVDRVDKFETRIRLRWSKDSCEIEEMRPDAKWPIATTWGDARWPDLFTACDFTSTRDIPLAPDGFGWAPVVGFTLALVEDGTMVQQDPIADTRERDIQAARVAEFDSRPVAEFDSRPKG